ncbi:MAG: RsmB/NOP family class I SAM-dependent RNA methyltransferase [Verrucomicrobia bacterium]|nr:RsmB/NOP family class I SAM-dependent RNA methyltransferase [Verrucomicrobiota bacterium]MCH8527878.1 RsmB/NOP family class I SAM-dependent RNA methyltransferase [Kiritimatiellia bacterium]
MTDAASLPPDLPPWASRQAAVCLSLLERAIQRVQQGEPADRALRAVMGDQKKYGSRDRRLFGDALFAWFRWYGAVREIPMARALCVAWYLDARPWVPALQAILNDLDLPCPEPVPENTPLAERKTLAEAAFGLSLSPVESWLPEWVFDETKAWTTPEALLNIFISRPPTWLRVDGEARTELHDALLADGAVWAGEAAPNAYAFDDPGKVHAWLHKHADVLEVQDIASQQVVRLCAPAAGQSWWDACCGAGGKSLQLLDESGRDLDLTCTDRREHVLREISRRGRKHGLARTRRYVLDLLKDPELPNIPFDGILVDAPCSGQGTWPRNPDAAWRTEERDIRQYSRRQLKMLEAVSPALKVGGRLVYSVCALTRSETTDVVEAFLITRPGFKLTPVAHPLTGEPTDGRVQILPGQGPGDGMFIAVFAKEA